MANNLTGDYDAVLQVSVRQINGLLATLHQNGAKGSGLSPSFPHLAFNMPVGSLPSLLDPRITQISKWLSSAVEGVRASGSALSAASPLEIGAHLAEKAPPGAVEKFNKDLADLISARNEVVPSGRVRGFADVQISTPAISLVGSEAVVHVYIRADYHPERGTPPLPAPIHGEVRVRYALAPGAANGKLDVVIPSDDSKIQFFPAPGSGLSQAEADTSIAVHVRKAIRDLFKPTPVDLRGNFEFRDFKALGSFGNLHDNQWVDALGTGDAQAVVLPVQLSGNAAPPGAINSVNNMFLGTGPSQNDFAIAVSKEFVAKQLAPAIDNLRSFKKDFTTKVSFLGFKVYEITYHVLVTSVDLQFHSGWMDLNIKAEATTRNIAAPQYRNIVINQRLTLQLIGQSVTLQALDSDFTISGAPGQATGDITTARNNALYPPPPAKSPGTMISETFDRARQQLNDALNPSFDNSASALYTAVEVNPDGIIVRGAISTKWHYDPVLVSPGETDDGNSFTGLETWIPGGRIDRYRWTWCEAVTFTTHDGLKWTWPYKCTAHDSGDLPNSFTYPKPAPLRDRPLWSPGICYAIEGTQVMSNGRTRSAGNNWGTCRATAREPVVVLDPLVFSLYEILGWPEPPAPDGALQKAIGGHVNILAAHSLPAGGLGVNTLVYFAGSQATKPLEAVGRALSLIRRRDFALTLVIVMPKGAFARTTREVEALLGMPSEGGQQIASVRMNEARPSLRDELFAVPLVLTEDYIEGWTRAFGVTETPAGYFMNARGEFVWKQNGPMEPEKLAAALDENLLPSHRRPPLPLKLTVQPGDRALDATFQDDKGQILALRRLRERQVLLHFWQSWSTPCITELLRLQQLQEAGGERAPVIIAVNGGEGRDIIVEVRRQYKLTFALVPDADQRFSQLYGVTCWPTTVSINPAGMVDRIQFGVTHTHNGNQVP